MRPTLARLPGPIIYGRCESCGHGVRSEGGADGDGRREWPREGAETPYADPSYYTHRDARGVGYDDYAAEAAYRLAKGERLVAAIAEAAGGGVRSLLEVGSGFGFTREAARRAGLATGGVDLNPVACAEAARRWAQATFEGDLAAALARPRTGVAPGAWDVVLYQFVLEHVAALDVELAHARRALAPGGSVALLVPSMEAAEGAVFGASYRSLRADHLHLFTRASLAAVLARAGFDVVRVESGCNVHLLRAFVSAPALDRLYSSGLGPDLFCIARSRS